MNEKPTLAIEMALQYVSEAGYTIGGDLQRIGALENQIDLEREQLWHMLETRLPSSPDQLHVSGILNAILAHTYITSPLLGLEITLLTTSQGL